MKAEQIVEWFNDEKISDKKVKFLHANAYGITVSIDVSDGFFLSIPNTKKIDGKHYRVNVIAISKRYKLDTVDVTVSVLQKEKLSDVGELLTFEYCN